MLLSLMQASSNFDIRFILSRIGILVTNAWLLLGIYMLSLFLKKNKDHKSVVKYIMVGFIMFGNILMLVNIWLNILGIEFGNEFLRIMLGFK